MEASDVTVSGGSQNSITPELEGRIVQDLWASGDLGPTASVPFAKYLVRTRAVGPFIQVLRATISRKDGPLCGLQPRKQTRKNTAQFKLTTRIFVGYSARDLTPVYREKFSKESKQNKGIPKLFDVEGRELSRAQVIWHWSLLLRDRHHGAWDKLQNSVTSAQDLVEINRISVLGKAVWPCNKTHPRAQPTNRIRHDLVTGRDPAGYINLGYPPLSALSVPKRFQDAVDAILAVNPLDSCSMDVNTALAAAIIYFDLRRHPDWENWAAHSSIDRPECSVEVFVIYFPHMLRKAHNEGWFRYPHPMRFASICSREDLLRDAGLAVKPAEVSQQHMSWLHDQIGLKDPKGPEDSPHKRVPIAPFTFPGSNQTIPVGTTAHPPSVGL